MSYGNVACAYLFISGGKRMAVELNRLYKEIYTEYEVKLLTSGCFDKKIQWVHMMEDKSFAYLLHGDELIFNSRLNYDSEEGLKEFIDTLLDAHAGGLVVALQDADIISDEIIQYCNQKQFPLFRASWNTSYRNIMFQCSEMILNEERSETPLIAALKNAIYYPEDDKLYRNHFERNGYNDEMTYIVTLLGYHDGKSSDSDYQLKRIEKSLQYSLHRSIIYEDQNTLVVLTADYPVKDLKKELLRLCRNETGILAAIGSSEKHMHNIHHSFQNATTAFGLAGTVIPQDVLCYEEIGIYQILADRKDEKIYPAFVERTLGKLITYDRENQTDYLDLLKIFFENECNLTLTASTLFFHKNTLKYKMNTIKNILGYDITSNRNRVNIMLSLDILQMEKD